MGLHPHYTLKRELSMNLSMMVDSGSTAKREAVVDVLKEKDEAGGYVSGGWKR